MYRNNTREDGFSLLETLFALLLFSLSFSALMHYQIALSKGFQQQWQQRNAWYHALQLFEGNVADGWQTQLSRQSGPAGCELLTALAISPAGRRAELQQLRCSPAGSR